MKQIISFKGNPEKNICVFVAAIWLLISSIAGQSSLRASNIGKNTSAAAQVDTFEIARWLEMSGSFDLQKPGQADSALRYLNKALVKLQGSGYDRFLYAVYAQFGNMYSMSGNYPIELDYRFKMLELIDNGDYAKTDSLSALQEYAAQYARIGICYFNMDNYTKALSWYRKSLEVVNRLILLDRNYPGQNKLLTLYGNIGSVYLSTYNFPEAEKNFEKALEISHKLGDPGRNAMLYNNLGIVYKERKEFDKAFEYYHKALIIRETLRDTAAMAQTYNNIGDALYLTGKYKESLVVLDKALRMSRQTANLRSQMKAANFLSLAYEKTGNLQQALAMYKLYKSLHDSIISNESVQNTTRLDLQYQYKKQEKERELQQAVELAQKERRILLYMTVSGILLFLFVILFLWNRNQRMKIRQSRILQESLALEHKNLMLEKHSLEMEKSQLQRDLEHRNKELNTHVMYLLRKNEFISSIINKLLMARKSERKPDFDAWSAEILRELQSNVDTTVWEEFEKRFQEVHRDFYQKLLQNYPDLTPNEIKICAFLKLNMTTKDISAITFQSVKSIEVARNRLRKKLDIPRDENLVSMLQLL